MTRCVEISVVASNKVGRTFGRAKRARSEGVGEEVPWVPRWVTMQCNAIKVLDRRWEQSVRLQWLSTVQLGVAGFWVPN